MSNIDKQALRADAVRAGGVKWQYMRATQHSKAYITDDKGSTVVNCTDGDVPANCAGLLTSANPATVLALLDELEAKDNRINRLEAIVAVAEQRNALMREWKRALKVPCDLVDDQVPVVIHGMVIRLERLKETETKLEAAEKRIAELSALQGKPIAWESTTPVYVKFITDERYQRLRPGYKKWYKPYRCSQCAAAGKGEAS